MTTRTKASECGAESRLCCRLLVLLLVFLAGCIPAKKPTDGNTTGARFDSNTTAVRFDPFSNTLPSDEVEEAVPAAEESSATVSVLAATADRVIPADPLDWLYWRGPTYNGVSLETGLIDDFDARGGEGSNVVWKREDLAGRSTPIVMGKKLYVIVRADPGTAAEGEKVVCVDAESGETIWENRFNVYLSDVPDTRVGWSSCVADPETGTIYAQGVCGHFQCIDAKTGETKWMIPLHERFGLLSTYGGRTNFPVICDDLVITSAIVIGWGDMAKPAHRFIGFDKRTGEVVWFSGTRVLPYDTTYSGPTLTVLNQQKSLVFASGDGAVWSMQPRTGRPIWQFQLSRRGLNSPPLVAGDIVYGSNGEENIIGTSMGAVVAIDSRKASELGTDLTDSGEHWRIDELMNGRTQPLLINDRLWVFDDRAKLQIVDVATGDRVGSRIALGRMMRASPLHADGKVYAISANGRWAIYEPDPEQGATVVSNGRLLSGEECHGSPICSHGRIYLPSTGGLYCLADSEKTPGVGQPVGDVAQEPDVSDDRQPAHVQLVPADVLMKPGQDQQFVASLFNGRGQFLGDASEVEFSLDGPGHVTSEGRFTAAKTDGHQTTLVTARVGSWSGTARVRVVPDLPWRFDFSDGQVPITWVGARYRHVTLDDDLLQALTAQNPLAGQLYIYLASAFTNTGSAKQTFDNSTPQQKWSAFQRYLRINPSDLEQAQQQLDPALAVLTEQQVLSSHQWTDVPDVGVRLTVEQGPRPFNGNGVMTKITTIPKGTRSRCWFGHSDLSDYTIQANVRGAIKDNKMPDIGLIAQGYALDLQGASQKLQIRSWVPQLRMAEAIDFPWEADQWYTLKFRASVEDGKAILRGKVWPKDEAEPEEWTIEATDDSPNYAGSPGLFGNAKDAEIFLDDVAVYAN